MTVINHHFAGFRAISTKASRVRVERTLGDYLPIIVGSSFGLLAGAVTLVAMFSQTT